MGSTDYHRPTWDDTWLALADLMAARSRCPSGAGAAIVDSRQRVVSTGYAGPPAGFSLPLHDGTWDGTCQLYCPRRSKPQAERDPLYADCPTSHAEQTAISFADRSRTENGTMYVSTVPCVPCAKIIANSGVVRVVWRASDADAYRHPSTVLAFFRSCDIQADVIG